MDILIINGDNPGDNELWMLWITLGIMWITSKIYPHPNGKTQAIRRFDGFFPGITLWMLRKTQKMPRRIFTVLYAFLQKQTAYSRGSTESRPIPMRIFIHFVILPCG